jgi:hypothetical protein
MRAEQLSELLDAATAEVPQRYQTAPLAEIHRRVRRRRATLAATASAVLVAMVLGGLGIARAVAGGPAPHLPAGPAGSPTVASAAPVPSGATPLPWLSAMVALDDRTITVYTGAAHCKDVVQPRADVTAQESGQVTIRVLGRVVDADCASSGMDVPVTVVLPDGLGLRAVRDGTAGTSRPVFHERNLPQLPAPLWSPVPKSSWSATTPSWEGSCNGPNGAEIDLAAWPGKPPFDLGPVVTTVPLGTRQGTVTGNGHGTWRVSWQVQDITYYLQYLPGEGGTMTQTQFRQLLTTLTWS